MHPAIRPLDAADHDRWTVLWSGYLAFYRTELPIQVTEQTWARLLDPAEPMAGLVAVDDDGGAIGLCHHVLHRSTWSPSWYCYLEDLFVDPDHRGRGVARALIEATAATGAAAGATKLYWQTHRTNEPARALYDQVAHHDGFLVYERDLA